MSSTPRIVHERARRPDTGTIDFLINQDYDTAFEIEKEISALENIIKYH